MLEINLEKVSGCMETTKEYLRPSSVVITLPDPKSMKVGTDGQKGGTFQWRTETHEHPSFEIRFKGQNPVDNTQDKSFKGDDLTPVVVRLNELGDYLYEVRQMDAKGNVITSGPHKFSVRECDGCHP